MRVTAAAIAATVYCISIFVSGSSLTVNTTNGPVIGHIAPNTSSVIEYLGIPYAQPPVGDLRWSAPRKYSGSTTYEASDWGYDCPLTASPPVDYPGFTPQAQRIIRFFASNAGTPQSEDCLTLNIWTKPTQGYETSAKPVLIFFYGGRFSIGNTNTPLYNGKYFADSEDLIIVTLNYRINIFGFPGAPGLPKQNLGLRDQRLAVEWIRDNIASFGGDPCKLTIFGQSVGGVSVDYWSYAYLEDPIVRGLASHSGNALSFPLNAAELQTSNWYNVSGELGCGTSGNTVTCMRTKKWIDIKTAAANVPQAAGGSPIRAIPAFYPVVDNETVFADYERLSEQGKFLKLPYLLGNNNNEQGYYDIPAYAHGINVTKAEGDEFLLQSFTCPVKFEVQNRRAHKVPVWQYRYFGHWANLRLYDGSGAYHGTDLEMLFGNSYGVSGIPPSEAEQETTALMQHYWAAFAADPESGLTNAGWPQLDPSTKSLIRLAYNNNPKPDFVKPALYNAPCSTITLGALQTAT